MSKGSVASYELLNARGAEFRQRRVRGRAPGAPRQVLCKRDAPGLDSSLSVCNLRTSDESRRRECRRGYREQKRVGAREAFACDEKQRVVKDALPEEDTAKTLLSHHMIRSRIGPYYVSSPFRT